MIIGAVLKVLNGHLHLVPLSAVLPAVLSAVILTVILCVICFLIVPTRIPLLLYVEAVIIGIFVTCILMLFSIYLFSRSLPRQVKIIRPAGPRLTVRAGESVSLRFEADENLSSDMLSDWEVIVITEPQGGGPGSLRAQREAASANHWSFSVSVEAKSTVTITGVLMPRDLYEQFPSLCYNWSVLKPDFVTSSIEISAVAESESVVEADRVGKQWTRLDVRDSQENPLPGVALYERTETGEGQEDYLGETYRDNGSLFVACRPGRQICARISGKPEACEVLKEGEKILTLKVK